MSKTVRGLRNKKAAKFKGMSDKELEKMLISKLYMQ